MSSLALAGLGVPVGAVFTLLVFALRAWVTKRREEVKSRDVVFGGCRVIFCGYVRR